MTEKIARTSIDLTESANSHCGNDSLPAQKKGVDPRNSLNDLNAAEWISETVSVWNQRGLRAKHPDAAIERQHPAAFSFTDVIRLVRFFTKQGDVVAQHPLPRSCERPVATPTTSAGGAFR